MKLDKLDKIR